MMKTQVGLFLQNTTAEEVRVTAMKVGVGIGDLADYLLTQGLQRLSEGELHTWAASLQSTKGRLGGGLTRCESAVLKCFDRLLQNREEAWRFSAHEIAKEAGFPHRLAFGALKSLQRRELVKGLEMSEEVDRWGRPVNSVWWRPEDARPPGKISWDEEDSA
jgi:hypothetical protein